MIEPVYGYDPARALDGPEAIAVFIADALETGDAAYIAEAMGVVFRSKGMAELAKEAGLASSLGPKLYGLSLIGRVPSVQIF